MDRPPSELSTDDPRLSWLNVALAFSFILANIFISHIFGLDVGTSLLIAAVRCVVQLGIVAVLLQSVFETEDPWAVAGIACTLCLIRLIYDFPNPHTLYIWLMHTVLLNLMGTFEVGAAFTSSLHSSDTTTNMSMIHQWPINPSAGIAAWYRHTLALIINALNLPLYSSPQF